MAEARGFLALEDGSVYRGRFLGVSGSVVGEVCFNTAMTGYQEILTDPSYRGQIVVMTYPHIGNYGINPWDAESDRPHVAGFVVHELCRSPSNWRSRQSLASYLKEHGIFALEGVDTRAITKRLRVCGSLRGVLAREEELPWHEAVDRARAWDYGQHDFVREVTCRQAYQWDPEGIQSQAWTLRRAKELGPEGNPEEERYFEPVPPSEFRAVVYDCGVKRNILRRLRQEGFEVWVVPADTPPSQALSLGPHVAVFSNGPGDPARLSYLHEIASGLLGKVPILGICLGHQILAHAVGGRTFKLKFGHRGANHPVQTLATGTVWITSQNHGFAVDPQSLPPGLVEVTQRSLYDGTCEALEFTEVPAFSLQYHPEASPGPRDSTGIFRHVREWVKCPEKRYFGRKEC
ncbi:glutamine-hydrolyzing carbamoyl-phosphate synthase small subunit [Candidatus Methylacidithermus pantelleriae]|uniref:Carbamoyl phosphate synthase small chain n=1 Tax=Candidatus Methylacidithermus pantelleriae TaxID=2744239 RepID=A0A8J2BQU4_9BACT|nr:glutamine-hydrolyzing carbamoyl-phosphate synthase small subunit [Candidatus Methylacidithermus pantelleriae]CAF0704558.1 Carbamoyl-phosphate synthase small chain [Candidatus Methylacidithermus pantelleriae]